MDKRDRLESAGREVWDALDGAYEFSVQEYLVLAQLGDVADELETLREATRDAAPVIEGSTGQSRVNPLFGELREHRKLFVRLLEHLALPDEGAGEDAGRSPAARKAQKAAQARWRDRQRQRGTA